MSADPKFLLETMAREKEKMRYENECIEEEIEEIGADGKIYISIRTGINTNPDTKSMILLRNQAIEIQRQRMLAEETLLNECRLILNQYANGKFKITDPATLYPPTALSTDMISSVDATTVSVVPQKMSIQKLINICSAKIQYFLSLKDFFTNGSDAEIISVLLSHHQIIESAAELNKTKEAHLKWFPVKIEQYRLGIALLQQNKLEEAFIFFHINCILLEIKYEELLLKTPKLKGNVSEFGFFRNIREVLEQHIGPKCLQWKQAVFRDKLNNLIKISLTQILDKLSTKIEQYSQVFNELVPKFPLHYRENARIRDQIVSDKAKRLQASIEQSKLKSSKMTTEDQQFLLNDVREVLMSSLNLQDEYEQSAHKIKTDYENFLKIHSAIQQMDSVINDIFSNKITSLQDKATQELEAIDNAIIKQKINDYFKNVYSPGFLKYYQNYMQSIHEAFTGENTQELLQRLSNFSESDEFKQAKMEFEIFTSHIAQLIERYKAKKEKAANTANDAAANQAKEFEEANKAYELRLLEHKANIEKYRIEKEKRQTIERKQAEELLMATKKQAREGCDIKKGLETATIAINDKILNVDDDLLIQIFSKPTPHNQIAYDKVVLLITALGGSVTPPGKGGSHRGFEIEQMIVEIGETFGLVDADADDSQAKLEKESEAAAGAGAGMTVAASGKITNGMVKPHKPGHNSKKLSGIAVRQFRDTLMLAGVTPENYELAKRARIRAATPGK